LRKLKLIDLYAGIGGIRLGFEQAFQNDVSFVFSNEIDEKCCITYKENFGTDPKGDITKIKSSQIPSFDILLAGFPCQAFSIAGRREGFNDIRGTHFFEIARILEAKKPKAFFLENVKHFEKHNQGKTFKTVKKTLVEKLGYTLYHKTLNASDFGLAQNRERIFMIGFKEPIDFKFPTTLRKKQTVSDILENKVDGRFFLSQRYLNTLKKHRKRHEDANHGFGYIVLDKQKIANTLVLGGMGTERNLIKDVKSLKNSGRTDANSDAVRRLTPREALRLQGFPNSYKIVVSNTAMFRQAANSVPINVIKAIALQMKKSLQEKKPISNLMSFVI
tara:strand:+ start:745 stop:1740 length:996 start_codon:yes stop_codon:yes gene_type:complete